MAFGNFVHKVRLIVQPWKCRLWNRSLVHGKGLSTDVRVALKIALPFCFSHVCCCALNRKGNNGLGLGKGLFLIKYFSNPTNTVSFCVECFLHLWPASHPVISTYTVLIQNRHSIQNMGFYSKPRDIPFLCLRRLNTLG